jgi:hypothetical protein
MALRFLCGCPRKRVGSGARGYRRIVTAADLIPSARRCPSSASGRLHGPAVMIGDSTWDRRAAHRAGVPCVPVLTGGYSEQELTVAGAVAVHTSLPELIEAIAEPPLRAGTR